MRKIILLPLSLFVCSQLTFSQTNTNTFPTTGNVGIGTTSPNTLLQVGTGTSLPIPDGAGIAFTPNITSQTTSGVAGISVGVYNGTNNRRAGLFVDNTNSLWGLSMTYGNEIIPFIIRMGGNGEVFRIATNNNVGIGTTSPKSKLDIGGYIGIPAISGTTDAFSTLRIGYTNHSWGGGQLDFGTYNSPQNYASWIQARNPIDYSVNRNIVLQPNGGKVGIGTTSPSQMLEVGGGVFGNVPSSNIGGVYAGKFVNNSVANTSQHGLYIQVVAGGGDLLRSSVDGGSTTSAFIIKNNGNVGIGTSTPAAGAKLDVIGTTYSRKLYVGTPDGSTSNYLNTYALAVDGSAIFTKAVVKLRGSWPDYIFSPNYQMAPLDSLENFIKQNRHLPDLPTEEEVKKDGIDLGSNQALLLKKIEELTLIVINQNKRAEAQQKLLELQNERIKKLESKLKMKK